MAIIPATIVFIISIAALMTGNYALFGLIILSILFAIPITIAFVIVIGILPRKTAPDH